MQYLIKKKRPHAFAGHIWNGTDTACTMASTGGLRTRLYRVVEETPERICQMCRRNHAKTNRPLPAPRQPVKRSRLPRYFVTFDCQTCHLQFVRSDTAGPPEDPRCDLCRAEGETFYDGLLSPGYEEDRLDRVEGI